MHTRLVDEDQNVEELERRVQRTAAAAIDELSLEPAERRYDELHVLGGELRQALVAMVREVPRLPKPLVTLPTCTRALEAVESMLAAAKADRASLMALDVEPDVADLVMLVARLHVAQRLRDVPVRATAQHVGVTGGYISELRRLRKGVPSLDIAARLDQWIPAPTGEPALHELVTGAKARRSTLVEQRRERRTGITIGGSHIPADLRGRDRLSAIADALRNDEFLQHAVELLVGLPDRDRRAIARLIEELSRT
jgi:hypothetical protein